jgi:hypothetical protein
MGAPGAVSGPLLEFFADLLGSDEISGTELMKRYLDLLAPPVQTATAIGQPQQAQQTEQTDLQPIQATVGQQRNGQKQQPRAERLTQPAATTRMPVMKQQQQPVEEQRQSQRQPQR